jgi:hypothetical protein
MLHNAHRTLVPYSGVVVAWAPKFKWMMLPYSKLVLSLKKIKLESHRYEGSISHLDSCASGNSKLSDREICSIYLRKYCSCNLLISSPGEFTIPFATDTAAPSFSWQKRCHSPTKWSWSASRSACALLHSSSSSCGGCCGAIDSDIAAAASIDSTLLFRR